MPNKMPCIHSLCFVRQKIVSKLIEKRFESMKLNLGNQRRYDFSSKRWKQDSTHLCKELELEIVIFFVGILS